MSLDIDILEISQNNLRELLNETKDSEELDSFLNTHYRFESIDLLIKELNTLNEQLNEELIELINGNFNQFVDLSLSLNGSHQLIDSIQTHLSSFNVKLSKLIHQFGNIDKKFTNVLEFQNNLLTIKYKIHIIKFVNSLINNMNAYMVKLGPESKMDDLKMIVSLVLNINKLTFNHGLINLKRFNSLLFEVKEILRKFDGSSEDRFEVFKMKKVLDEVEV